MDKVLPFPRYPLPANVSAILPGIDPVPSTLTHWTYHLNSSSAPARKKITSKANDRARSRIMATLNATPDSFSDGSTHNTVPTALAYAHEAARASVDIMDIGGYSTRPGAAFVSVEEEINRVVPIVQAMRSGSNDSPSTATAEEEEKETQLIREMPISIDTFRWEVAEKAILAGANCINDVYAFTGPNSYPYLATGSREGDGEHKETTAGQYMQEMRRIARKLAVPVVLMHSRGDAGMNKDYSAYDYVGVGDESVLEGVRVELGIKVDEIIKGKGGVRRWNVIVDPGIGFSKTVESNLELLRQGAAVTLDIPIGQGELHILPYYGSFLL